MTPREVNRKYSKGLDFDVVLRNGYRKRGMCASDQSLVCSKGVESAIGSVVRIEHTAQEQVASVVVRGDALQESQCVANPV